MNKFLVPEFLLNFKCIGNECENTCCQGWNIFVDKQTFHIYNKSKNPIIKNKVQNSIGLNKESKNDANYAKIILDENKQCPFLDGEKLCLIHSKLGHEALCYTCKVYPRIYNKVGNLYEQSLHISCPEVARLALLNKEKMSFTETEIENNLKAYCRKTIEENENTFWMVRIFTIDVLQDRRFKLWERLGLLGIFFEQSSNLIQFNEIERLSKTIEAFKIILDGNEVHSLLSQYKKNSNYQFDLTMSINEIRKKHDMLDSVFNELLNDFEKGISIDSVDSTNGFIHYKENYDNYYINFINNYEYILENYLVHFVFTNLFPFGTNKDAFDEYFILTLNFILIKTYFIGISGTYKKLDEAIAVKLIHAYTRVYDHGVTLIEKMYEQLKDRGLMTLENMILLIRD